MYRVLLVLLVLGSACENPVTLDEDSASLGVVFGTLSTASSLDIYVGSAGSFYDCDTLARGGTGASPTLVENGRFRLLAYGFLIPPGTHCFDLEVFVPGGKADTIFGLGPVETYRTSVAPQDSLFLRLEYSDGDAVLLESRPRRR